jgi:hypothetical protein
VDVFEAAGLEKRELTVLSEEFLAEIRNYKRKSLAVIPSKIRLPAGQTKTCY